MKMCYFNKQKTQQTSENVITCDNVTTCDNVYKWENVTICITCDNVKI